MLDLRAALSPVVVAFGTPEHGWLPVIFQAGEFQLKFDASDVPVDPLETLCEALAVVPAGGSTAVLWWLEPAAYWFVFEREAEEIVLTVTESPNYNQLGTAILRLTGSVDNLLLPFYEALKVFTTSGFSYPHWPTLESERVARLGQFLQPS